ncbi:AAA family ATPase [Rhodovulum euryhalinum]|uniref:Aminoglycoside phosphotransferase domain-containing protein n=1 Tax=Rhodovulum euryhalinum TaxID=35805 RepID=A0A4R2KNJ3_9RHOB|nr:AAA family ATPase [Rhodovulum euryhalinum]TCO74147.1 hypothetical protein EV655_101308 [Rhodovulum euryhalinum]
MTDESRDPVTAFFSDLASRVMPGQVQVIETHISRVFLIGDRAYKLKRPVRLPYTDGSTAELRLATCRKEFDLNARTAPGLYLGVRRITRAPDGTLTFDGGGPLVDAVVEMVRFDQEALFDRMAERGALTESLMAALAEIIARFHAEAPVVHSGAGGANIAGVLDINRAGFATSDAFAEAEVARLDGAFRRRLDELRATLDSREAAGKVRRCHGDLHLRNICLFAGRPTLFDCIEFNDQIATVDVLYDLAFLLMDLWHRGLHRLANLVANRYFDTSASDDGFELLTFFMALRAAVRAHVTATFAMGAGVDADRQRAIARDYFDLSIALLDHWPARVLAIGGLSGSGKTTIAEALAPHVGAPPGARLVESDLTRKAHFAVPSDACLPPEAYRPEVSDRVYSQLATRARTIAAAGASVVVAAVFDRPDRRAELGRALADHAFSGVWLSAEPETLRARVRTRPRGASDATLDVLEAQLCTDPGPIRWPRVCSEGSVTETAAAVLAAAESTSDGAAS